MRIVASSGAVAVLLVTLAGCKADFGDQAYDWVDKHGRSYSERLATGDLQARWANYGNRVYGEIEFSLDRIDELHSQLFSSAKATDARAVADSTGGLAATFRQSKASYDLLLRLKRRFAEIDAHNRFLATACSRETFDALGLARVATYNLLGSFWGMAHRAEWANDQRRDIYVFTSFEWDENGNPRGDPDQRSSSDDLKDWLKSMTLVYQTVFSWINEEEIEQQKARLQSAIDLLDKRTLKPDEVYVISRRECEAMQARYAAQQARMARSLAGVQKMQNSLLSAQAARLEWSYLELIPPKLKAMRKRLGLTEPGAELQLQSDLFDVLVDFDRQLVDLEGRRLGLLLQCRNVRGLHAVEEYQDALNQTQRNLNRTAALPWQEAPPALDSLRRRLMQLQSQSVELRALVIGSECG